LADKTGLLDMPKFSFYKPPPTLKAQVAQLVEHAIENRSVGGSIPPLGTILLRAYALRRIAALKIQRRRAVVEFCKAVIAGGQYLSLRSPNFGQHSL
jgi:hypothetical protein